MSELRIVSSGERVAIALSKMEKQLVNLSPALLSAGVAVRDAAVMRIKTQGGEQPWVPSKGDSGHTGIDTGRMWQSIAITEQSASQVVIGTNVFYAKYFQEGTGIFAGHSPWTIRPVKKRALAFSIGGQQFFARSIVVPGQPARPFLYIDHTLRDRIMRVFGQFLQEALSGGQ